MADNRSRVPEPAQQVSPERSGGGHLMIYDVGFFTPRKYTSIHAQFLVDEVLWSWCIRKLPLTIASV